MSFFTNMKIAGKIACIVIAVSMVGMVVAFFSSRILLNADTEYSDLIDHESKATLLLARSGREANRLGYAVYRNIVYDGGTQESRDSLETARAALKSGLDLLNSAKILVPAETSAIDGFVEQLTEIGGIAEQVLTASVANDNDRAKALMVGADTKIAALTPALVKFNEEVNARVAARTNELTAMANMFSFGILAGTVVGGLLALVAAILISARTITGPLGRLRGAMEQLAGGRLDVSVDGQERRDEVGAMAKTVQVFKDAANENKRLAAEAEAGRAASAASRDRQAAIDNAKAEDLKVFVHHVEAGFDRLSAGDLTVRMKEAVAPEFEPIRQKFNDSVTQLEETIGSVVGAVGSMRVGLNQITVAAGDLSQRTEQQAASLEETVAALGEVMRGVNGTAQSADDARSAASLAQTEAEKGGEVVARAITSMTDIEKSSTKIGNIISVIDEIAFQTNLLALNAGVEAARAGEAGRGFAVVAQEVRGLAQRSAEAAKEIKDLISTSSAQVEQGVELVSATGQSLGQIVAQVGGVTKVITDMAQSAREQATSLKEVATAADQMDKVTQQNAAMVEETTAAAQSLLGETEQLAGMMERFRTGGGNPAAATGRVRPAARPSVQAQPSRSTGGYAPVQQMKHIGTGGAAPHAAAKADSWEEF